MTCTRGLGTAMYDPFLVEKFKAIIAEHGITTLVETGVNEGKSSVILAGMVQKLISVDIDPVCLDSCKNLVGNAPNVEFHLGHSPDVLKHIMPDLDAAHTMFFLDAHWGDTAWPLPAEVEAVTRGQGIFILHDIKVPGKDFGFDLYEIEGEMRPFEFQWVEKYFKEWSPTFRVEYNEEAGGDRRGVAFVYPS